MAAAVRPKRRRFAEAEGAEGAAFPSARREMVGANTCVVDVGAVPEDVANYLPCALVLHTWVDVDDPVAWTQCINRRKYYPRESRWRLGTQIDSDSGHIWCALGVLTAESRWTIMQQPAWLPPVASCVVEAILTGVRDFVGYIEVEVLEPSDSLVIIPPPFLESSQPDANTPTHPIRCTVRCESPVSLIRQLLLHTSWHRMLGVATPPVEELAIGQVCRRALTPRAISVNLYGLDCVVSYCTSRIDCPRDMVDGPLQSTGSANLDHLVPDASSGFDVFLPEDHTYEVQAMSLGYSWSGLPFGQNSFLTTASCAIQVFDIWSGPESPSMSQQYSLAVVKHDYVFPDEATEEDLPHREPTARRARPREEGSRAITLDEVDFSGDEDDEVFQIYPVDDDDEEEDDDDQECSITGISRRAPIPSDFLRLFEERGWQAAMSDCEERLARDVIYDGDTLRFREGSNLYNTCLDEWAAAGDDGADSSFEGPLVHRRSQLAFTSRLLHLLVYGHLMYYCPIVIDSSCTRQEALAIFQDLQQQREATEVENKAEEGAIAEEPKWPTPTPSILPDASMPSAEGMSVSEVEPSVTEQGQSEPVTERREDSLSPVVENTPVKEEAAVAEDPNAVEEAELSQPASQAPSSEVQLTPVKLEDALVQDTLDGMMLFNSADVSMAVDDLPPLLQPQEQTPAPEPIAISTDESTPLAPVKIPIWIPTFERFGKDPEIQCLLNPEKTYLRMRCNLFPHQLEAVKWMRRREEPSIRVEDGHYVRGDREDLLYDLSCNAMKSKSRCSVARGGILADEMGLGKTIEVIATVLHDDYTKAIIAANPFYVNDVDWSDSERIMAVHEKKKPSRKLPQRATAGSWVKFDEKDMRMGCTLVIAPLSVISSWQDSILKHTELTESAVCIYHGAKRTRITLSDLAKHIFVITTYATLVSGSGDLTDLHRIHWRRVVLDEGHEIRNARAKRSKAVFKLIYDIGWVISGTPFQNDLADIASLLKFLGVEISDWSLPQSFAVRSMMLRRTKAMLTVPEGARSTTRSEEPSSVTISDGTQTVTLEAPLVPTNSGIELPPKRFVDITLTLEDDELRRYQAFRMVTRALASEMTSSGSEQFIILNALVTHMRLLAGSELALSDRAKQALLTALKFAEDHPDDTEAQLPAKLLMERILQSACIRQLARLGSDEDAGDETMCPICFETGADVVTACSHPFHRKCLEAWFKKSTSKTCPACRAETGQGNIVDLSALRAYHENRLKEAEPAEEPALTATEAPAESTKIKYVSDKILEHVNSVPDRSGKPVKVVVFSTFVRMLRLMKTALTARGVKAEIFSGDLAVARRNQIIGTFMKGSTDIQVLLSSYGAGSTGLTLTSAHIVYLLDPWWNPFVEDQAVNRVHRLGQTRGVVIYRISMADTVEQGVIACQRKKRQMSQAILGAGGDPNVRGTIAASELQDLLRM